MLPYCNGFRPDRRSFLHVGVVGGLGLTLDQFFRLQAAQAADAPRRRQAKPAPAQSIIHIFLPGGMAHQESFDPKPLRPDRISRRDGHHQDQARRRRSSTSCLKQDRPGRRQDHRLPLDDARRGGPRARHAQHVHRLPAQPGPRRSRAWAASSRHEFGAAQQPAALRLHSQPADHLRRHRLPRRRPSPRSASAATRPTAASRVQDLTLPGGVDDKRFTTPPQHARRRQRPLRRQGKGRRPGGDGHLLPAGLQPDQLARRPARRSTSTPSRPPLRDEYGRNAAGQRMLLARRLVAAGVRFVSLTYGGWDMHGGIKGGMPGQLPAVRPGASPP